MDFKTAVAGEILEALKASFGEVDITPESVNEGAEPRIVRDPERPPRPRLGAAALRARAGGLANRRGETSA